MRPCQELPKFSPTQEVAVGHDKEDKIPAGKRKFLCLPPPIYVSAIDSTRGYLLQSSTNLPAARNGNKVSQSVGSVAEGYVD